jgi:hypothetical protein
MRPPRDAFVEVVALRDCGTVMTEMGPIALPRNSLHLMRWSDAERLIRDGSLKETQE